VEVPLQASVSLSILILWLRPAVAQGSAPPLEHGQEWKFAASWERMAEESLVVTDDINGDHYGRNMP
jgi:hypothetical protein